MSTDQTQPQGNDEGVRQAHVQPPFSAFVAASGAVAAQLDADGLSRPQVFVRLRRWAMDQSDVEHLVVGHTGKRYTIAVLVASPTLPRIREIHRQLAFVDELLDGAPYEAYVLGREHADASVFTTYGTQTVHRAA